MPKQFKKYSHLRTVFTCRHTFHPLQIKCAQKQNPELLSNVETKNKHNQGEICTALYTF